MDGSRAPKKQARPPVRVLLLAVLCLMGACGGEPSADKGADDADLHEDVGTEDGSGGDVPADDAVPEDVVPDEVDPEDVLREDGGSADADADGGEDDAGPDVPVCLDDDGDGYGTGCDLGEDCDDTTAGITGPCDSDGCPAGWVLVPAGDFEMGCNIGEPCDDVHSTAPRHTVTLSAFCIQRTEVGVAEYRACRDAGACTGAAESVTVNSLNNWSDSPAGREAHPINGVNWHNARNFCQDWVAGDLPSEAQWERAARGTDSRRFPWGDTPPPDCDHANFDVNGTTPGQGCASVTTGPVTWPVDEPTSGAGDSPAGLRNTVGNVFEWVLDCMRADAYERCAAGCVDPVVDLDTCGSGSRTVRGGSYMDVGTNWLRTVSRSGVLPLARYPILGFRCARVPVVP
jgi:formylglycine-generating enzyme required for sulfatase activity